MSFRSAISGRFVKKWWAKLFPWIVVEERLPRGWSKRDLKIGGSE
jgi:hypothetical protein